MARLDIRGRQLSSGNAGDMKRVGEGVSELLVAHRLGCSTEAFRFGVIRGAVSTGTIDRVN